MRRSAFQTGGAGAGCCGCPAAPAWRTAPPDRRPPWCGRRQNRRCARSQGSPVPLQGRKNRSRTAPARPECGRAASCSCCAAGPRPGHRTAWRCRYPPGQSSWPAAQRLRRPGCSRAGGPAPAFLRFHAAVRRCGLLPAGGPQRPGPGCTRPWWRPGSRCGRRSRPGTPAPPARCRGCSWPAR